MNILHKLVIAGFAIASLAACEVEKTQEGEMPDVEVSGGQVPKYDVDGPDVEVGTKKKEVTVPTVDVDMPDDDDADGE